MTSYSAGNARWMNVDQYIVVFNPGAQGFVELDPSGAELWNVLAGNEWRDEAAIAHLQRVHGIDPAAATDVVARFINDLVNNGMLTRLV